MAVSFAQLLNFSRVDKFYNKKRCRKMLPKLYFGYISPLKGFNKGSGHLDVLWENATKDKNSSFPFRAIANFQLPEISS